MNRTDFIDDDLIQRRDAVRQVKFGPSAENGDTETIATKTGPVPVQELNLTPLAKKRDEINNQMVSRMDELERLRTRQEALEKERNALEQLRQNQEKYETGKRDLIERLEQHMVYLEREEVRLNQHLALLMETDGCFKEMLEMARSLDEASWPTDSEGFRDELRRSLMMVENARKEFNKAMARIEALHGDKSAPMPVNTPTHAADAPNTRSFTDWLLAGLAASLPLIITILAVAAALYFRPAAY